MRALVPAAALLLLAGDAEAQTAKEAYELQERCGRRASEVFTRQYGNGLSKVKDVDYIYNYRNYYNAKLNKCFYAVTTRAFMTSQGKREEIRTVELFDLNANNRYGIFIGIVGKTSPSDTCEVRDNACSSEEQWWQLSKPYLGD